MKKNIVLVLAMSLSFNLQAETLKRCSEQLKAANKRIESLLNGEESLSEDKVRTQMRTSLKTCSLAYKNLKDVNTAKFLNTGSIFCFKRNAQNSPLAEAICLKEIMDLIKNYDQI